MVVYDPVATVSVSQLFQHDVQAAVTILPRHTRDSLSFVGDCSAAIKGGEFDHRMILIMEIRRCSATGTPVHARAYRAFVAIGDDILGSVIA